MFFSFCINMYLFTSAYIGMHQYTFVCSCPLWATVSYTSTEEENIPYPPKFAQNMRNNDEGPEIFEDTAE